MVGAGQLARMTHQAAVDLDVELVVLAESERDPAVLAGAPHRLAAPADADALVAAATGVEVVTFDHELVPPPALQALEAAGHALRPGPAALAFAQDKLHARLSLAALGFPVPAFAPVGGPDEVEAFAGAHGWPVVMKARSGGYDGRGVLVVDGPDAMPALRWSSGWVAEEHLDLEAELAVVVARRPSGEAVTYPVVQTTQVDGICRHLVVPVLLGANAGGARHVGATAEELATAVASAIDAVGICAVELFVPTDGRLLVNEVALRPHNSGHATIEACVTSQFENHLRAVLHWPLGATDLVAPAAAMVNVITPAAEVDPAANLPDALGVGGAHVHLYAKASRPGRKVGHVTALGDSPEAALATAQAAADILLRR
ncbi:MAG: 5-(carboxyamino)imidazole ribonucleotide synthase [Acidimicrobiales bacterium]